MSYLATPDHFKKKHFLCNVKCDDGKSFAYSVLASLYPAKADKTRVSKYKKFLHKLNMTGNLISS